MNTFESPATPVRVRNLESCIEQLNEFARLLERDARLAEKQRRAVPMDRPEAALAGNVRELTLKRWKQAELCASAIETLLQFCREKAQL